MKENKMIFPSAEGGIQFAEITDGGNISEKAQMASYQVEEKYNCTLNDTSV